MAEEAISKGNISSKWDESKFAHYHGGKFIKKSSVKNFFCYPKNIETYILIKFNLFKIIIGCLYVSFIHLEHSSTAWTFMFSLMLKFCSSDRSRRGERGWLAKGQVVVFLNRIKTKKSPEPQKRLPMAKWWSVCLILLIVGLL